MAQKGSFQKQLKANLQARAETLGFQSLRCVRVTEDEVNAVRLDHFLRDGRHGDMDWMATHAARRRNLRELWPDAKSALVVAFNYTPDCDPLDALNQKRHATISVYAKGKDYHDVIKPKLKQLARFLQSETGADVKVFVDTAPIMEKPLGQAAGLGWQGKHTNLVSREGGSWFFIGVILTTAELEFDAAEDDHCGACRRCLDICPTQAFPKPYQLDARRCISYLTIEHKGHIDRSLRTAIGNRVYGCDDCLAICPWNKFAVTSRDIRLDARPETDNPPLHDLLDLDDAAFRERFRGTAIKRTGRDRFLRNVLIASGNSADPTLITKIIPLLSDPAAIVRAMAVWALGALCDQDTLHDHFRVKATQETDADVKTEWQFALAGHDAPTSSSSTPAIQSGRQDQ